MNIKPNITIHDFNAICRLCLKRERRLKPIFKSEASDAESYQTESVPMNQMVNVCIGIHVITNKLNSYKQNDSIKTIN